MKVSTKISSIFVNLQVVGLHHYPDAPEEVMFLRYPHRHVFHIRVETPINHSNRDIEFLLFKKLCQGYFNDIISEKGIVNFGAKSCEMIAEDLIVHLQNVFDKRRCYQVTVSEDGENGAIVIQPAQ